MRHPIARASRGRACYTLPHRPAAHSKSCHPERRAARAVVEEERLGACGRRAAEGPLTSSAGGKKREFLRLRPALHTPHPPPPFFPHLHRRPRGAPLRMTGFGKSTPPRAESA